MQEGITQNRDEISALCDVQREKKASFKRVWPAANYWFWTLDHQYIHISRQGCPRLTGAHWRQGHPCKVWLGYEPGKAGLTITALSEPYLFCHTLCCCCNEASSLADCPTSLHCTMTMRNFLAQVCCDCTCGPLYF